MINNTKQIHLITKTLKSLKLLGVMLMAVLLLSGCVKYDVGVNFESPHHGMFVQHIKLGEQLTSFNQETAWQWLDSIEQRGKQLKGSIKRVSKQEIVLTIPFNSGKELEERFNKFFNPNLQKDSQSKPELTTELPNIASHLNLNQGNFIFWVRNHLSYDLDLRSLAMLSNNSTVIINPKTLFNLEFSLETPWGSKSIQKVTKEIIPIVTEHGNRLVWQLTPGELNHLEAVFWLPSPLGIGTVIIFLIVIVGFFLKYKKFPGSELIKPTTEKAMTS